MPEFFFLLIIIIGFFVYSFHKISADSKEEQESRQRWGKKDREEKILRDNTYLSTFWIKSEASDMIEDAGRSKSIKRDYPKVLQPDLEFVFGKDYEKEIQKYTSWHRKELENIFANIIVSRTGLIPALNSTGYRQPIVDDENNPLLTLYQIRSLQLAYENIKHFNKSKDVDSWLCPIYVPFYVFMNDIANGTRNPKVGRKYFTFMKFDMPTSDSGGFLYWNNTDSVSPEDYEIPWSETGEPHLIKSKIGYPFHMNKDKVPKHLLEFNMDDYLKLINNSKAEEMTLREKREFMKKYPLIYLIYFPKAEEMTKRDKMKFMEKYPKTYEIYFPKATDDQGGSSNE